MLMNSREALDYSRELSNKPENRGNVFSTNHFIGHLEDTLEVAEYVVGKVFSNNSWIDEYIDRNELMTAAVLHDIGRPLCSRQLYHELRGASYLETHGISEGIGDDIVQLYRIAQMIRPHANGGCDWAAGLTEKDKNGITTREDFMPIDGRLLTPSTWQELLIYWVDSCNLNGKPTDISEKRKVVEAKYCDVNYRGAKGEVYWKGEEFAKVQKESSPIIIDTCRAAEKLIDGRIEKEQIMAYGFL